MSRMRKHLTGHILIISALVFMNALILNAAITENKKHYWTLIVSIPLLLIAVWGYRNKEDPDSGN
jgi:hypothetical protein